MQLPAWKLAKLLQRLGGFKREQKLAQLVGHGGRHPFGGSILPKLLQPFVAKADKLHAVPGSCYFFSMYGLTVHVKPTIGKSSPKSLEGWGRGNPSHLPKLRGMRAQLASIIRNVGCRF